LRPRLWADDATVQRDDDGPESENQARQLDKAQLAAHTEQLGELDARASRRLELVSKGVVEQYLESRSAGRRADQTNAREADFEGAAMRMRRIREAVVAGRITREQAAERLGAMRQRGDEAPQQNATEEITNHQLYQQTIKDVLSAEAYARYQARQAESLAFHQLAARDVVGASLDLQLWLGEKQRKHFEQAPAKLFAPPEENSIPTPAEMVARLHDRFSQVERQVLSPWQSQKFEVIRAGRNR